MLEDENCFMLKIKRKVIILAPLKPTLIAPRAGELETGISVFRLCDTRTYISQQRGEVI